MHMNLIADKAVGTGSSRDKPPPPPAAGRQGIGMNMAVHQQAPAQTKRAGIDDPSCCSICGARSHTDYFCAYNYMDGGFSTHTCSEQCSPGRHAAAPESSLRRFVRVTNVPSSLGERELRWLFQRFGPLRECVISREGPEGGAGFGFVTFENRGDAEAAVDGLNGHRVGDRRLRVDWAYPRALIMDQTKLAIPSMTLI
ncbi:hypothetical protein C2845_PM03G03520 [Panicum miliaceum]|uniref:RRM domain-containing protein n=1 Tax=Panicum miliaceum TaxID=4540 RepID=A0A3L6TBP2_PANMI|nr:hypothetical protein C2845_PM03G03520 [Panicum miliaceum]